MRSLDSSTSQVDSPYERTLPELVSPLLDSLKLRLVRVHVDQYEWTPHPPKIASLIHASLADILLNVRRHARIDDTDAAITLTHTRWGGRTHDVVVRGQTVRWKRPLEATAPKPSAHCGSIILMLSLLPPKTLRCMPARAERADRKDQVPRRKRS